MDIALLNILLLEKYSHACRLIWQTICLCISLYLKTAFSVKFTYPCVHNESNQSPKHISRYITFSQWSVYSLSSWWAALLLRGMLSLFHMRPCIEYQKDKKRPQKKRKYYNWQFSQQVTFCHVVLREKKVWV